MNNETTGPRAGDGKSLDDERKAFECEMRCEETWGHRSLKRNGDGYANRWVNFAWDVWKERAALDAVPDVPACGPALAALQLAEELATERLADARVANEGYPHRCVGEVRDLQTIRAGLAALAAAPAAAPAWQPIETAPKDGRKLILFYLNRNGKARTVMARWVTDEEAAETDADGVGLEGGWYECIDNWDEYSQVTITEGEPSRWMALPANPGFLSPATEAQTEGGV